MDTLNVVLLLGSLVLFVCVIYMVGRGRLLLKYSLLWMVLTIAVCIISIFPQPIFALGHVLGFENPSNFIFAFSIFGLVGICLSLTVIVSRLRISVKNLTQEMALLHKELEDLKVNIKA